MEPVDQSIHEPGQAAQMELCFPEPRIPAGFGQSIMSPVMVMTLPYSRLFNALMIPDPQAEFLSQGFRA